MRIKITLEMSGNEFLNLLRRVPKTVAQELFNNSSAIAPVPAPADYLEQKELFTKSATGLIDAKKR